MGDDAISLLNWREDTLTIRARHPDYPPQAETPEGHVNEPLLGKWPLGECRQAP
jgi:hypothetical protein